MMALLILTGYLLKMLMEELGGLNGIERILMVLLDLIGGFSRHRRMQRIIRGRQHG
jgi:hypothetical protein